MPLGRDPSVLERRKASAARLCHDLGKSVRFQAPASPESSADALRQRLESDLLRTRCGAGGAVGAIEIFDVWWREEGALFEGEPALAGHLGSIARAIDAMREGLPRIATLEAAGLRCLDEATRVVWAETRALRDAVSVDPRVD